MAQSTERHIYDIVVVGHGISGLVTAIEAKKQNVEPVILEKSPKEKRGGHARYAGGAFRFSMEDPEQVKSDLGLDVTPERYSKQDFFRDLMEVSGGRADPDLCDILVENSFQAMKWLDQHGIDFTTELKVGGTEEKKPLESEGAGGTIRIEGEGAALIESLAEEAEDFGIDIHYKTEMQGLVTDGNRVTGVEAKTPDGPVTYEAQDVVICSGTFASSSEKRTRYLGRDADEYVVRGSRYNTGEALDAALDVSVQSDGQWGGGHQVLLDERAPEQEGGRTRITGYQYALILNENGERFVDEGEDIPQKTYAKFGRDVFDQPNQRAYVVYDDKISDLVDSQMGTDPIKMGSLESLLERVGVQNIDNAINTIDEFNDATTDEEFDPASLDGKSVDDVTPKKSNWAIPVEEPPFYCYPSRAGITFIYGGLKITPDAKVLDTQENTVPGLWAVGNSTAGFFYGNYPAGTALTVGATFGRLAARNIAEQADD
jgi:tricarballylate dehydrogenase